MCILKFTPGINVIAKPIADIINKDADALLPHIPIEIPKHIAIIEYAKPAVKVKVSFKSNQIFVNILPNSCCDAACPITIFNGDVWVRWAINSNMIQRTAKAIPISVPVLVSFNSNTEVAVPVPG